VTRRIVFRAAGLVFVGCLVVAGLTVYFSSQKVPPCLLSNIPRWSAPTDRSAHHFEVVVPDRALCFFDIDNHQELVGYIALKDVKGITAVAPRGGKLAVRYANGKGALVDLATGAVQYSVENSPAGR
jgi:hypothetical protein